MKGLGSILWLVDLYSALAAMLALFRQFCKAISPPLHVVMVPFSHVQVSLPDSAWESLSLGTPRQNLEGSVSHIKYPRQTLPGSP